MGKTIAEEKAEREKALLNWLKPGVPDVPESVRIKINEIIKLIEWLYVKVKMFPGSWFEGKDFARLEEALGLDSDYEVDKDLAEIGEWYPYYKIDPFDSQVIKDLERYLPHCRTNHVLFIQLPNGRALEISRDYRERVSVTDDNEGLFLSIRCEMRRDKEEERALEEQEGEFWKNFKGWNED